jgi:16S rRNA (uracil1498-N3)-methyltransferase
MQLPLFYSETLAQDGFVTLNEETSKHVSQVLRMKASDLLQLTDGKGSLVTASVTEPHKRATIVTIIKSETIASPPDAIALAVSPLKNAGRFEWLLEKATELGVNSIIPILCERTEKQHLKQERLHNILISAMLQSRQVWLPEMQAAVPFSKALEVQSFQQKYIAHCADGEKQDLNKLLSNHTGSVVTLIGPEGDFSLKEIDACIAAGFTAVSLGKTRLRTETAGMVASVLMAMNR